MPGTKGTPVKKLAWPRASIEILSAVTEIGPAAPGPKVPLAIPPALTIERLPALIVTGPAGPVDPDNALEPLWVKMLELPAPIIEIVSAVTDTGPAAPAPMVLLKMLLLLVTERLPA